jgi:hypothetical protein
MLTITIRATAQMTDAATVRQELQLVEAELDELSHRRDLLLIQLAELEAQDDDVHAEDGDHDTDFERFSASKFPWSANVKLTCIFAQHLLSVRATYS